MEEKEEEIIYRICYVCKQKKPLSEFYSNKTRKLGKSYICKTCAKIQRKRYRANHMEEIAVYLKKYREDNKQEKLKRDKRYYKTEKGRLLRRCRSQRRRARRAEATVEGGGVTPEEFSRIVKNQGGKCNMCVKRFCKSRPATLDHIIPLSKGGLHTSANIQALCKSCNSSKNAKILKGYITSWSHK